MLIPMLDSNGIQAGEAGNLEREIENGDSRQRDGNGNRDGEGGESLVMPGAEDGDARGEVGKRNLPTEENFDGISLD